MSRCYPLFEDSTFSVAAIIPLSNVLSHGAVLPHYFAWIAFEIGGHNTYCSKNELQACRMYQWGFVAASFLRALPAFFVAFFFAFPPTPPLKKTNQKYLGALIACSLLRVLSAGSPYAVTIDPKFSQKFFEKLHERMKGQDPSTERCGRILAFARLNPRVDAPKESAITRPQKFPFTSGGSYAA